MDDKYFYAAILGIREPWTLEGVELKLENGEVNIRVDLPQKVEWICSECEEVVPIYNNKEYRWRHLDTCLYRHVIHARVPRLNCQKHGIKRLRIPPVEPDSQSNVFFKVFAMNMWDPYFFSTKNYLHDASSKIIFDKFHVARRICIDADTVRKLEHRKLMSKGGYWVKVTQYDRLPNPDNFSCSAWRDFLKIIRVLNFATVRAWAIKEYFMTLRDYRCTGVVRKHFDAWYGWPCGSKLEQIKKVALTLMKHWLNIKTYFHQRINTAGIESINSIIQRVKYISRDFRNLQCFHVVSSSIVEVSTFTRN